MAASNLIAKTMYSDDKESVYCQVQVAFTDFYEEVVRHSFYVVYPEDDSVTTVQKCVRAVQQKLQPSLVVHVGTACSSGERIHLRACLWGCVCVRACVCVHACVRAQTPDTVQWVEDIASLGVISSYCHQLPPTVTADLGSTVCAMYVCMHMVCGFH